MEGPAWTKDHGLQFDRSTPYYEDLQSFRYIFPCLSKIIVKCATPGVVRLTEIWLRQENNVFSDNAQLKLGVYCNCSVLWTLDRMQ